MENNRLFGLWKNHSMRDLHVALSVITVALHVCGNLSGNSNWIAYADILALVIILHFFVHSYFYRQQKFVADNQRIYTLPKKKIAKIGGLYLVVFLLMTSIGMAVVKELYSGTLLAKVKALCLYLLNKIFGAIVGSDGLGEDKLALRKDYSLLDAMNQSSAKTDSIWEQIMNNVQTVLIIIGVVFLIALCVIIIVNYVRNFLGKTGIRMEGQRGREVSDREEKLRKSRSSREKFYDFSPTAKARRMYRKCINRKRKGNQTLGEWMTPQEIERVVSLPQEEHYMELHRIYEKARYSESGCSLEDAQRMKELKL
jgi:hypothetical protein